MNAVLKDRGAAPAWTSLHVFIHDFARLDGFLCECLAGMPRDFLADAFFIRYWLGGPHVRIRFRHGNAAPVLEAWVRAWLARNAFDSDLEPDSYYRRFASQLHTEPRHYWHGNGELHYIAYQPEVARYGGPAGLALCERYFVDDSNAVLALLREHAGAQVEKILLGCCLVHYEVLAQAGLFDAFLQECHGVPGQGDLGAALRARMGTALEGAMPGLRAAGARYGAGEYYPAALAAYRARLHGICAALTNVGAPGLPAILHSLLHMSFNRAGVTPLREQSIRLFALALYEERTFA